MITPALVIGLGGTGKWVLTHLKSILKKRYPEGSSACRLLVLDADPEINVVENITLDYNPKAKIREFIDIADVGDTKRTDIYGVCDAVKKGERPGIAKWLLKPEELMAVVEPNTAISSGAKQIRQVGCLALYENMIIDPNLLLNILGSAIRDIKEKSSIDKEALEKIKTAKEEEKQKLMMAKFPKIFIVSSAAGGTGGALFLHMAYILKKVAKDEDLQHVLMSFIVLPGSFKKTFEGKDKNLMPRSMANTVASMRELNRFMLTGGIGKMEETISYDPNQIEIDVEIGGTRPFNFCYLVDGVSAGVQSVIGEKKIEYGVAPAIAEFIYNHINSDTESSIGGLLYGNVVTEDKEKVFSRMGIAVYKYPEQDIINAHSSALAIDVINLYLLGKETLLYSPWLADDSRIESEVDKKGERNRFLNLLTDPQSTWEIPSTDNKINDDGILVPGILTQYNYSSYGELFDRFFLYQKGKKEQQVDTIKETNAPDFIQDCDRLVNDINKKIDEHVKYCDIHLKECVDTVAKQTSEIIRFNVGKLINDGGSFATNLTDAIKKNVTKTANQGLKAVKKTLSDIKIALNNVINLKHENFSRPDGKPRNIDEKEIESEEKQMKNTKIWPWLVKAGTLLLFLGIFNIFILKIIPPIETIRALTYTIISILFFIAFISTTYPYRSAQHMVQSKAWLLFCFIPVFVILIFNIISIFAWQDSLKFVIAVTVPPLVLITGVMIGIKLYPFRYYAQLSYINKRQTTELDFKISGLCLTYLIKLASKLEEVISNFIADIEITIKHLEKFKNAFDILFDDERQNFKKGPDIEVREIYTDLPNDSLFLPGNITSKRAKEVCERLSWYANYKWGEVGQLGLYFDTKVGSGDRELLILNTSTESDIDNANRLFLDVTKPEFSEFTKTSIGKILKDRNQKYDIYTTHLANRASFLFSKHAGVKKGSENSILCHWKDDPIITGSKIDIKDSVPMSSDESKNRTTYIKVEHNIAIQDWYQWRECLKRYYKGDFGIAKNFPIHIWPPEQLVANYEKIKEGSVEKERKSPFPSELVSMLTDESTLNIFARAYALGFIKEADIKDKDTQALFTGLAFEDDEGKLVPLIDKKEQNVLDAIVNLRNNTHLVKSIEGKCEDLLETKRDNYISKMKGAKPLRKPHPLLNEFNDLLHRIIVSQLIDLEEKKPWLDNFIYG